MQYAPLGATGISVSRLCIGTATFGLQTDEEAARKILDKAAESGINFIDTADSYPMSPNHDQGGRTEEILGRWLKGRRDDFIVATKGGAPSGPHSWNRGSSRKHLLAAVDQSLRRLGSDHIDLYQLHFDDRATPLDELASVLDCLVRSGKARYVGVSNFFAYRLARLLGRQDVLRLARVTSVQPRYSLLFREIERELLPLAKEESIAVMPFNPLAGGMLSGKYRLEQPPAGRFAPNNGFYGQLYRARYWHERQFDTVQQLSAIAGELNVPLPTLAVAWVLANPVITAAILGASRVDQLADTLAAAALVLDGEVKARLDALTQEYRQGDAES
jgi:aryl-alcohol dehydrogenase-like predicted oxidoreductase